MLREHVARAGVAAQAADQVLAEVGMVPDAGQGLRVQGLQHQGAEAAAEHAGEIRVHLPGGAVGAEQAGIASRFVVVNAAFAAREGAQHPGSERCGQRGFHALQCRRRG